MGQAHRMVSTVQVTGHMTESVAEAAERPVAWSRLVRPALMTIAVALMVTAPFIT